MRIPCKVLYYLFSVVCLFGFLCASARPAWAYVDPGSGLLLYQVSGSLITGFLVLCRKRLRRLLGFLSAGLKRKRAVSEQRRGLQAP